MQAEILIVPTPASMEMLKEMAQTLAQELVSQGISVNEEISLCPDRKRLQHAISKALQRSTLVFTLGGMGRDSQFLAKQVMSEGLGLPLEHSEDSMVAIESYAARRGIALTPDDATLASLPSGSRPLLPSRGILPGAMISSPSQHIVLLPENAEEILPMLTRQVMPVLAQLGESGDSTHTIRTYGISENQVRQMIADLLGTTNPIVTTIPHGEEVEVRVSAKGVTSREASQISAPVLRTIAGRLEDYAYGLDVASLEEAVVEKMQRKQLTLSIAEAGTSGMFIHRMTRAPGGNQVVNKAIIAEDNQAKIEKLGFTAKELRKNRDVSEWTAVHMAHAARHEGLTHLGAAITAHIPGFSQNEAAVAYIAICDDQDVYVKKLLVEAESVTNHETIVEAAVSRALNMLRLFVDYLPESYQGSIPLAQALAGKVTVTDKESYQDLAFSDEVVPLKASRKQKKSSRQKEKKSRKERTPSGEGGGWRKILLLVAVAAFVFGAVYLGRYFIKSMVARSLRDDLAEVYDTTGIEGLYSLNGDTVGFVELEGTALRYPVVQAGDNNWYLRRDFNEKSNPHGVPFLDFRANPKKPSDNLVIYGHNMRDGQIFGELMNYTDLAFYQAHPIIKYEGLKGKGDYKVFAVFKTSAEPSHFDDGVVFNYPKFVDAGSEEEFDEYIYQVKARSILNIPVDVEYGDKLLTLSTCDYDVADSRFVVMARQVRSRESSEMDGSGAEVNPSPLYPDVWYQTYGGTKPDVRPWNYEPSKTKKVVPRKEKEKEPEEEESEESGEETLENSLREEESSQTPTVDESAAAAAAAEAERQRHAEAAQAEAQRQEAERLAAEEEARKAQEEAAQREEEERKKAEEAKAIAEAEDTAVAQSKIAAEALEEANSYHQSALNSRTKKEAEKFAESAEAAAVRAENAAAAARQAANLSGSTRAEHAAVDAENYASEARRTANTSYQTAQSKPGEDDVDFLDTNNVGTLYVSANRSYDPEDPLDLLTRVVQNEVGTTFHPEAVKAQAVAAYTFIKQANTSGTTPSVALAPSADPYIKSLVGQVFGEAVYYNGGYAFTPYHATSAGATTSSQAVWGGNYPYLISVDSSVDQNARGYRSTTTLSADKVSDLISDKLGIETYGDPSGWIEILSEEEGGYVGNVAICGETRSQRGTLITGRLLREAVFGLRSACFDVSYNPSSDSFTFTTYGYGHGVGMSQTGANGYAQQGWDYVQILQHYYPGASVK